MSLAGQPQIAFFGSPGAGKTTLAAAFAGCGVETIDPGTDVFGADALVVAVDATAGEAEFERTCGDVRQFLDGSETGRTHAHGVADLPVFLTLTKCDAAPAPAALAGRVRTRFREYLADRPDGFGSLDVTVTTAGLPADARFARTVADAAAEFRSRSARSARHLSATTSAAGATVVALAAGIVAFFSIDPYGPDDPLVARVRAFQAREGPPAVRLADAHLARNRRELKGLRESSGFERLPEELREYVLARSAEFDAYAAYRERFQPPRLGPAAVRTAAELDRLEGDLRTSLAPPAEYATAWVETDGAKLRAQWAADAAAVRVAEARIHDGYRSLIRRATGLLLVDPFDPTWKADSDALIRDAAVPIANPADPLPNSSLTYAVPLDFARIDYDLRDWDDARTRLVNLRNAVAAVSAGGVFDFPPPTGDTAASLTLGSTRWKLVSTAAFAGADGFPEPARTELRKQLLRAREKGTAHVRATVRAKLAADTPDGWRALAPFGDEPGVVDWGRLLARLDRHAGETDPTVDLASFLRRESFACSVRELVVSIPVDLSTRRLDPGPTLTLTHGPAKGETVTYRLSRVGEPTRHDGDVVARYVPDGWDGKWTMSPGDELTASLPVSDLRLVWDSNRTKTFAFESLSRPASLVPAVGPRTPATGVKVTVTPVDGIPVVPVTIPDLSIDK